MKLGIGWSGGRGAVGAGRVRSSIVVASFAAVLIAAAVVARAAHPAADGRRQGRPPAPAPSPGQRARSTTLDPMPWALAEDEVRPRPFPARTARAAGTIAKPAGVDLDALYIQMTPLYHAYCLDDSSGLPRLCAGTENDKRWPDRGEVVTFTAHFMNKGTVASGPFEYAWAIDGAEVARGSFPGLAPGTGSVAVTTWPWGHDVVNGRLLGRHTVRFALDPDGRVAETCRSNNVLEDRTDATPLGFQVTPEVYRALETPVDASLPFSAEDWAQKQFRAMNDAFARSVYPSAPNGCEERVRLNQLQVVPNQVANDGGIGGWFLASDDRFNGSVDPATDLDWAMVHELGHQLGVIDLYNFDFWVNQPHRIVDLSGRPVLLEHSSAELPGIWSADGPNPPVADEHTTAGMNADKGYRRGYFGEYQYDLPPVTRIRVLDATGAPAAGVTVRAYRVRRWAGDPLAEYAAPGIEVATGPDGTATLPNRPSGGPLTTATGHTLRDNPLGAIDVGNKNMLLVEIRKGAHQEFAWLANTDLNLVAWRGGDTYEFVSHVPGDGAPLPPPYLGGKCDGGNVALRWGASPSPGVARYNVYRTAMPRDVWVPLATSVAGTTYATRLDRTAVGYVVTAVDGVDRESAFSETFWGVYLESPSGIAIGPDNRRYARLWPGGVGVQDGSGRTLDWLPVGGYDHGHLAWDAYGHLLATRESGGTVAVMDPAGEEGANILREIGEPGSGAGQFSNPTGVVALGDACAWGGPYAVDAHTLLLCHFDGTARSEVAATLSANGLAFVPGKYGLGALVAEPAAVWYATPPLLSPERGAIELWVQPRWNGDDGNGYVFLSAGTEHGNGVSLFKDGANNLRFLAWAGGAECGVGFGVSDWKRGDWHHLAVTWQGSDVSMYVDGAVVAESSDCRLPADFGASVFVGSNAGGRQQANALLDELRISDVTRLGDSDTCTYRIVVTDTGNDRLQLFDPIGRVVGAYGTTGSGPGAFRAPKGIASDGAGRIVVVDSANRRLQLFAFDGAAFTFIREIAGDLLDPDGVAFRRNRIVVADTGHDQVKVFSDTGELVATYDGPNDGVYTGAFSAPGDVAIDLNGRIVVADTGNDRVVEVLHSEGRAVRHRLRRTP